MQILYHVIYKTWAFVDFSIHRASWNQCLRNTKEWLHGVHQFIPSDKRSSPQQMPGELMSVVFKSLHIRFLRPNVSASDIHLGVVDSYLSYLSHSRRYWQWNESGTIAGALERWESGSPALQLYWCPSCFFMCPVLFWPLPAGKFSLLCGQAELWQNLTLGSHFFQAMNRIQLASLSPISTLIVERIWVRGQHWVQSALSRETSLSAGREISEKEDHEPVMLAS